MIALFLRLSKTALEAFTMGASAAISLYCGSYDNHWLCQWLSYE